MQNSHRFSFCNIFIFSGEKSDFETICCLELMTSHWLDNFSDFLQIFRLSENVRFFRKLRTWIHGNLCYLTIKSDPGPLDKNCECLSNDGIPKVLVLTSGHALLGAATASSLRNLPGTMQRRPVKGCLVVGGLQRSRQRDKMMQFMRKPRKWW